MLHSEGTEAAQLHPVAAGESTRDLIEHDVDDALHVAMEEMRIGSRYLLNQLRLYHETPHPGCAGLPLLPYPPLAGCRVPNGNKTVKLEGSGDLAHPAQESLRGQAKSPDHGVEQPAE